MFTGFYLMKILIMNNSDNVNANNIIDKNGPYKMENNPMSNSVTNLTDGFLEVYQPHLKNINAQLNELTIKQKVVIEQLHNENLKIAWSQNSSEYDELFKKIHMYRDKLITIKKDMRLLHEKSTKLKKRAIRLQQIKERDDLLKKQQRQKEEELIKK